MTNAPVIRALIVDDEPSARELLSEMLLQFCADVQVIGEAEDAQQALQLIQQHQPNLVLLDLQIPEYTGFELLDMLPSTEDFCVIFITAYDQHALQAFRHQAVDYLVKPVGPGELIQAIDRARAVLTGKQAAGHQGIPVQQQPRLRVPTPNGFQFIRFEEIEAVSANRAYADLVLRTGEEIVVSQPLSKVIELLPQPPFVQVHRSHAVNLSVVRAFDRTEGSMLIMYSERRYPIARARQDQVLALLEQWG